MLCVVLIALLFMVFPLCYFFPVDPETVVGTPVIDYIDDEPFLPEQPGKPPPPRSSDIAYSFSLLLALE